MQSKYAILDKTSWGYYSN